MSIIELPRLVGTRDAARELVENNVTDSVHEVTLHARAVLSAAPSFVDELIADLERRGVQKVELVGASDRLVAEFRQSAERHKSELAIGVARG